MKESVEIRNTETARILTDITQARLLEPFFADDTTLSDAAKQLDIKLTTLLYHVTKFMRLGLLEVTKEEARKGKAVKYYRTTANAFSVPFDITPSLSLKQLLTQLTQPTDDVFNREAARTLQEASSEWLLDVFCDKLDGITISIRRKDRPRDDVSFDPNNAALVSSMGTLYLDFVTAKAFQKDLRALLEQYKKKQNPKEQLYFYRVGLTPAQDDSFEVSGVKD
jgi:hypothetical protein